MGFDTYWHNLVEQNPSLTNENARMSLSVAAFKRALERSFHAAGRKDTAQRGKAGDDFAKVRRGIKNPLTELVTLLGRLP